MRLLRADLFEKKLKVLKVQVSPCVFCWRAQVEHGALRPASWNNPVSDVHTASQRAAAEIARGACVLESAKKSSCLLKIKYIMPHANSLSVHTDFSTTPMKSEAL